MFLNIFVRIKSQTLFFLQKVYCMNRKIKKCEKIVFHNIFSQNFQTLFYFLYYINCNFVFKMIEFSYMIYCVHYIK